MIYPDSVYVCHVFGLVIGCAYVSICGMKLTGKIVHGQGRGHHLGIPTINLSVSDVELPYGVYAVRVSLGEQTYGGAMNWGARPTFDESNPVMEIHLLDFEGEVYGELAEVEIVEQIRDVMKFATKEELVAQIEEDIAQVKSLL